MSNERELTDEEVFGTPGPAQTEGQELSDAEVMGEPPSKPASWANVDFSGDPMAVGATGQPDSQMPPIPESSFVTEGAKWGAKNVLPIVAGIAGSVASANPFFGIALGSAAYSGTNFLAKKLFGSPEESQEAFSDTPRDLAISSIPSTLAQTAWKIAPPAYKLPLALLGSGIGMLEAEVIGKAGKQALKGQIPTGPDYTAGDVVGNVLLGAGAEFGISRFAKGLGETVAPELMEYGRNAGFPALFQELGSTRDRLLRFLGSSQWGQSILKQATDKETQGVVKSFLTKAGLADWDGPQNFNAYMEKLTKPMREAVGATEQELKKLTDDIVEKNFPKEVRPQLAEAVYDYMRWSNQMTDSVKRDVRLKGALRAVGTPDTDINALSLLPKAGTEEGFEEALKTLPDRLQASEQIAGELTSVLKPISDFANDMYNRMMTTIKAPGGGGDMPLRGGRFVREIGANAKQIKDSLSSLRNQAGATVGIVNDVIDMAEKQDRFPVVRESVQLVKDINYLLRKAGGKADVKRTLGRLKSALVEDIPETLERGGAKDAARLYSDANLQYAQAQDQMELFAPYLDEVMPGWDKGIPLQKTNRDYIAASEMFKSIPTENLDKAFDALGSPQAVSKIKMIRKQQEVRDLISRATLGTNFDDEAFIRQVKASPVLSRNEKISMITEAQIGKMRPGETMSSFRKDLLSGEPKAWGRAKSAAAAMGISAEDLAGWAAHEGIFKKSIPNGEFDLGKFVQAARANPNLVKTLGMEQAVKMATAQRSLFDLPAGQMEKMLKAFDSVESMPALAQLFFTKNKTFNPKSVNALFRNIPVSMREPLRYEIFNHLLRQGGPEINLPQAVANLQQLLSKDARRGLNKATITAIFGPERAAQMFNMAKALERLNSFRIPTEDVVLPAILKKASSATPSPAAAGATGLLTSALSYFPLKFMLSDPAIFRNITKGAYAAIAKMKSPMKLKEQPNEK